MNNSQPALFYQKRLNWKAAAREWERNLEVEPHDQKSLSGLAKCYRMLGDFTKETQIIETLKRLEPLSEEAINAIAWFYLNRNEAEVALDYYQSLMHRDINLVCSLAGIALCHAALGHIERARNYLNKARVRLPLTEWDEYFCLARACLQIGRHRCFFRYAVYALAKSPTILVKIYILSALLSYPLLALRTTSRAIRIICLVLPWILLLLLERFWASLIFLLILPIWLGGAVQSWLNGQRRLSFYALGVLILSLILLMLK